MLTANGVYTIPLSEYIADPAPCPSLNASTAHTILTESPYHAWIGHPRLNPNYVREESSRQEMGSIAHAVLIDGDESKVMVIEADDWRTKAAKEEREVAREGDDGAEDREVEQGQHVGNGGLEGERLAGGEEHGVLLRSQAHQ